MFLLVHSPNSDCYLQDGPTAAKHIRKLGLDVNMVGITGNILPEDVSYFISCGANDVLAKPIKMPDLYASWVENGVRPNNRKREKRTQVFAPSTSAE
jgi:CheY-like chemotaxis protein